MTASPANQLTVPTQNQSDDEIDLRKLTGALSGDGHGLLVVVSSA